MVEVKPIDVLTDRNLTQWFLEDEMYKGMKLAPKLKYQETDARRVDYFSREKSALELFSEGVIEEPMHSAAGSELTLVRSGEMDLDSARMRQFGYRYIVENDMMKEAPELFLQDFEDLAYGLATHIETAAATAIRTVAVTKDSNLTLNDGNWDGSTKITTDLSDFKAEYNERDQRKSTLDQLFYNTTNLGELRKYIINKYGEERLRQVGTDIDFSDIMHYYMRAGVSEGETFGWFSQMPPGSIVYRKLAGAYEPAKIENGAAYRPLINLVKIEHEGLRPKTEFQFGIEYAIPITRPNYLFYNNI